MIDGDEGISNCGWWCVCAAAMMMLLLTMMLVLALVLVVIMMAVFSTGRDFFAVIPAAMAVCGVAIIVTNVAGPPSSIL